MCHVLRLQLGEKLIKSTSFDVSIFIVLLCDIKAGTNDTIEVTLVSELFCCEYFVKNCIDVGLLYNIV